jgi:hypothetical protein
MGIFKIVCDLLIVRGTLIAGVGGAAKGAAGGIGTYTRDPFTSDG